MAKYSIRDLELSGTRAFVRVDFNVPIKNGRITDETRLTAALPTVRFALERGATVILASHLGRPKGKPNPAFTLAPVARRVGELLEAFADRDPAPVTASPLLEPLSAREQAILRFLPTALSNREIADELSVTTNTVKTHLRSVYRKLDVARRRDAVERARELRLLSSG